MTFRLGLTVIIGVLAVFTVEAQAACSFIDFTCKKFERNKAQRAAARRRAAYVRRRRAPSTVKAAQSAAPSPEAPVPAQPVPTKPAPVAPVQTSMNAPVVAKSPPAELKPLKAGAITRVPKILSSLVFGTSERVEMASATCEPTDASRRRVTCAVAIHRLAQTATAGAGCTGSLSLRRIEFTRTDTGDWLHEDTISLCGGRLLRRTELFPVSLNGRLRYALRETNQLLGGNSKCAAPYLRSRAPLHKSYTPGNHNQSGGLRCGLVMTQ